MAAAAVVVVDVAVTVAAAVAVSVPVTFFAVVAVGAAVAVAAVVRVAVVVAVAAVAATCACGGGRHYGRTCACCYGCGGFCCGRRCALLQKELCCCGCGHNLRKCILLQSSLFSSARLWGPNMPSDRERGAEEGGSTGRSVKVH